MARGLRCERIRACRRLQIDVKLRCEFTPCLWAAVNARGLRWALEGEGMSRCAPVCTGVGVGPVRL